MAASRSLNEPVVIVTLVSGCAACAVCTVLIRMKNVRNLFFTEPSLDLCYPTLVKSLGNVKRVYGTIIGVFAHEVSEAHTGVGATATGNGLMSSG